MSVSFGPVLEYTLKVFANLPRPSLVNGSTLVEIGLDGISNHHQIEEQRLVRIIDDSLDLLAGLVEDVAVQLVAGLCSEDLAEEHQLELVQVVEFDHLDQQILRVLERLLMCRELLDYFRALVGEVAVQILIIELSVGKIFLLLSQKSTINHINLTIYT